MARRRRGATLLATFTKASGEPAIYWVASRVSKVQLLRSFSQVVYAHAHPLSQASPDFAYPTWEMALQQLAEPQALSDRDAR